MLSAATATWLAETFGAPSAIQAAAWPKLSAGRSCLLVAPTGSGKTLAAFLAAIDRLQSAAPLDPGVRVVYVSPLRALAHDIEQNLMAPLEGIAAVASRLGVPSVPLGVSLRTGDSKPAERQRFLRRPSPILITTPESLFLLLQSRAAEHLRTVETVIIDELHALYPSKRGAHLMVTLERLGAIAGRPLQRIGLSATVADDTALARYLGEGVEVVRTKERPRLSLSVDAVEAEDGEAGQPSGWSAIHARLLSLILAHRSTIVFANSRRLCERLAQALNDRAAEQDPSLPAPLVLAHHGSLSLPRRRLIEAELKAGRVRALCATSSLELGVDYGAVDLVVQIESPGSASRGLQRVGRAGHHLGGVSEAWLFAKHTGELPELAAVSMAMTAGTLEPLAQPRAPLDVLSQQIVAIAAASPEGVTIDDVLSLVTRAQPYRELRREEIVKLVDVLAGHHPQLTEVRPLLNWDRAADRVVARAGAVMAVRSSPGTIPDRGLFSVRLADGTRIGELDEEMTYESRVGDTFLLGATAWNIVSIGVDRLIVEPVAGGAGRMPFWRGDRLGRPTPIGEAMSQLLADLERAPAAESRARLITEAHFTEAAADRLLRLCHEQREATGLLPSLHTIVVERFADELGDERVAVLSPWGGRVHAPWALLAAAQIEERTGVRPDVTFTEDGIAFRWSPALAGQTPGSVIFGEPTEIRARLLEVIASTPLFASRFRECAARALMLLRRGLGKRRPLWLERRRAQALLQQARALPDFPITRAALTECFDEVYDLDAFVKLWSGVQDGTIRVHEVRTAKPSPMAQGLSFAYLRDLLYAGDAPAAEQRAQSLVVDEATLTQLTGLAPEPLDGALVDAVEDELQRRAPGLRAESADEIFDLLRRVGPLDRAAIAARTADELLPLLDETLTALVTMGRLEASGASGNFLRIAGEGEMPTLLLVQRFAATHGPFTIASLAAALGIPIDEASRALAALPELVHAPFGLPDHVADRAVVRRIRRRAVEIGTARSQPVSRAQQLAFVGKWQSLDRSAADLATVIERLAGWSAPADAWLHQLLPSRVARFVPTELEALLASGELGWRGLGRGHVTFAPRLQITSAVLPATVPTTLSDDAERVLAVLEERFACFASDLIVRLPALGNAGIARGLWELVWAGLITNDSLAPLLAYDEKALQQLPSRGARPSPLAAGRWSRLPPAPDPALTTDATLTEAGNLLARWGVVDRVIVETIEGQRFAPLRRAYKLLEERGRVRFGAFVEGGMQFASLDAVEQLRAAAPLVGPRLLSAHDPFVALALPPGTTRRQRDIALVDGVEVVALYDQATEALRVLAPSLDARRLMSLLQLFDKPLELATIDGEKALRARLAPALMRAGARPLPGRLVIDPRSQSG